MTRKMFCEVYNITMLPAGTVKLNPDAEEISNNIFKQKDERTGKLVAIKVLPIDRTLSRREIIEILQPLTGISHPALLKVNEWALQPDNIVLLSSPFVENGSLASEPVNWTNTTPLIILYGVARGLNALNMDGYVHMDLKPGNVLLDAKNRPLLTHFCLPSLAIATRSFINKDLFWLTPEELAATDDSDIVDPACDVYTWAMLAYCLIEKWKKPFPKVVFRKVHHLQRLERGERPVFTDTPPETREFLMRCWEFDGEKRPEISEVVEWIENHASTMGFADIDESEFSAYKKYLDNPDAEEVKPVQQQEVPETENESLSLLEQLRISCSKGDAEAMFFMGERYEVGDEVEKNEALAGDFYKKSADGGCVLGQLKYALMKHFGLGSVSIDINEAATYYRLATEQGSSDAMNNLAGLIEMEDVDGSLSESLKLYESSAELGNPRGCVNYARFLELGKATAKDLEKALVYYKKAAELGDITGKLGLARLAGDVSVAKTQLKECAETGDFTSIVNYAGFLLGTKDYTEAARWYKEIQNSDDVIGKLGMCYIAADGSLPDVDSTSGYSELEAKSSIAMNNLGVLKIRAGEEAEGIKLIRRAAQMHDPHALYNIALLAENGCLGLEDGIIDVALKESAAAGCIEAMEKYATRTESKDPVQSLRYYKMAVDASGGKSIVVGQNGK